MDAVAGYEVQAKLHESTRSLIYRGQRCHDKAPVILKMPKADYSVQKVHDRYLLEAKILDQLKTDLQHCLDQFERSGTIAPFPLAQQDFSGQFQLPQKLYGRAQEIDTLLASFDRIAVERSTDSGPKRELVLVKGYSGIGKTALVRELYKPITRQQGYFISGKFDQLQRNIP